MVKKVKKEPQEKVRLRLVVLSIATLVMLGALFVRLWYLQVLAGEKYGRLSEENRIRVISLPSPRGLVFDRNGEVLVGNRPALAVLGDPQVLKGKKEVLKRLSHLLEIPLGEIEKKLKKSEETLPHQPLIIKEDVGKKTVVYLKENQADFPGVEVKTLSLRDYPSGSLAAHVVGYLGEVSKEELKKAKFKRVEPGDLVGKGGLEKVYQSLLQGKKGKEMVEVNALGHRLKSLKKRGSSPGKNLVLTLDKKIQEVAEASLAKAILSSGREGNRKTKAGAAVVLNPRSGEVLALASYPTYDPRIFIGGLTPAEWRALNTKESGYPLNNRAFQGLYPPGSTFKPVTAIAAAIEGLITPKTSFVCPGKWTGLGGRWAKFCWKKSGHGRVDLVQAIVVSCDSYFYETGKKLHYTAGELLQKWARHLGLGRPTGLDLPGELPGRVPDSAWKKEWNKNRPKSEQIWYPGDTVNLSIGQGDLLTTPLQMATVYATIANGGTFFKPHLLKKILTSEGKVIKEFSPTEKETGLPVDLILALQRGLRGVVEGGTANQAFAGFPVTVSGKTGTSQVRGKTDFAWFVAYAPTENPQYVISVLVEEGGHGGSTAAPVAREILSTIHGITTPVPTGVTDVSR